MVHVRVDHAFHISLYTGIETVRFMPIFCWVKVLEIKWWFRVFSRVISFSAFLAFLVCELHVLVSYMYCYYNVLRMSNLAVLINGCAELK